MKHTMRFSPASCFFLNALPGRKSLFLLACFLCALLAVTGCRHATLAPASESPAPESASSALVVKIIKQSPLSRISAKLSVDGRELGTVEAGESNEDNPGATGSCHLFSAPAQAYKLTMELSTQNQNSVALKHQHTVDLDGEPGATDYVVISLGGPGNESTTRVGTFKIKPPAAETLAQSAAKGGCLPWTDIRDHAENYAIRATVENEVLDKTLDKARAGDPEAQLQLARMYLQGDGVEKDGQKALEWATKAGEAGHIPAQILLSAGHLKGLFGDTDNPQAFAWASRGADQGDAKAMALVASYYKNGFGVQKDPEKAFEWFLKAAEKGHMVSMIVAGESYYNGVGVEKNLEEAFAWRLKAAYGGSPAAANTVGQMYYRGEGVAQNYEKAFTWLQWAAERGSGNACATLGLMYFQGQGAAKDPAKAIEWFTKGAAGGNLLCMSNLGNCYLGGAGVDKDPDAAKQWLAKAGAKGYVPALNKLALLFLQEKDSARAQQWAALSAKAGNPSGVYLLGLALAQAGDLEKSLEVLDVALKAGHPQAAEAMEKIRTLQGQPVPGDDSPEIVPADPASSEE
ncbi:MAG: SEL1-like repeat protein [Desulfatibacillum sp.]|nr:SEL1-like repeat protein [Desulfatibacillum sp.]